MRRWMRPVLGLGFVLSIYALAVGCRQEVEPLFQRNQQPETYLTILPEDSTQGFYRYHVYWNGVDPDGRVVRYIFAITDTVSRNESENWDPQTAEDRERSFYTTKTDSVFIFNSERGRATFNIAAIDDYGRLDRSPARAFFRVSDNGDPQVVFLDVSTPNPDIETCQGTSPCSIPTFTNFRVRFTGTTRNNRITGYQWQAILPGDRPPEPIQPFGADSLFLPAGIDATGLGFAGDTLYTLRGDVVTVYYRNPLGPDSMPSGNFQFRARVRDEASRASSFARGNRVVTINYDPDTQIYRVPACDCPNAPPDCATRPPVRAGWMTGKDNATFADTIFCEGDTIPALAHIHFFATGHDDARDVPIGPTLRDVGFSYRYEWTGGEDEAIEMNGNMPFSTEYRSQDEPLPPPYAAIHGGRIGWGAMGAGVCPFDFTLFAAAVDEHGKRDGTPDQMKFYCGGSPVIDSVSAPRAIVLVPRCPLGQEQFCPNLDSLPPFGPDTLLLAGEFIAGQGFFPFGSGHANRFTLPIRAWGHDHPRDRGPAYAGPNEGKIRAWRYAFDCISGCEDLLLPGERQWELETGPEDPPGEQIFDRPLSFTLLLDTLCTNGPSQPCGFQIKMTLPTASLGTYDFFLQGRDTDPISATCQDPADLSPGSPLFRRTITELGRRTQREARTIPVVALYDVRKYALAHLPTAQSKTRPGRD